MAQSAVSLKAKAFLYKLKLALPPRIRLTIDVLKKVNSNPEDLIVLDKKKLSYAQDLLYTFHNSDFMKEPKFIESYKLAKEADKGFLIGEGGIQWRIHVICWAAFHVKNLEGDFVDCGVSTGICPQAIVHYIDFKKLNKTYYLLDTFTGLDPKYSTESEMVKNEMFGYSKKGDGYEHIKALFAGYNTKIIKGTVPDTLPQVDAKKVCYLHLDMNCVLPEVAALEYFWDKMVSGGIIIFDDYAYRGATDQKEAHDQFAASKGVKILSLPTSQGLLIKP